MSKTQTSDLPYDEALPKLQLALVRLQQHAMAGNEKVLVIFEGRDAAGKDGTIHRITEHMSVRATRVVALSKPSDVERTQWYFQRYTPHLPSGGQFVIFNRSWYNRAGVERVMGFSAPEEQEDSHTEGATLREEVMDLISQASSQGAAGGAAQGVDEANAALAQAQDRLRAQRKAEQEQREQALSEAAQGLGAAWLAPQ